MNTEDLFDEVQNSFKEEKLYKLMRKLVPLVIIGAIIIVIAVSIWQWHAKEKRSEQLKMSEIFYKATVAEKLGKPDMALESYEHLIKNHKESFTSLAFLRKANLCLGRKEYDKAYDLYEEFINSKQNIDFLKYLARTYQAMLLLNGHLEKRVDIGSIIDGLNTKDNPWRGLALELKILWLLQNNYREPAKNLLEKILSDEYLADIYKQRATEIMAVEFKGE